MNFLLAVVSLCSAFLPALSGILVFRRGNRETKLLVSWFILASIIEIVSFRLTRAQTNNIWIENICHLAEFVVFSFVLAKWIGSVLINRLILAFYGILALVFSTTTIWVFGSIKIFNVYSHTIESIMLVFLAAVLLYRMSGKIKNNIFLEPRFWFGTATLIFYSANIVVFGLGNYILDIRSSDFKQIWVIHSLSNIFFNLLCTVSFLCNFQTPRSS